MRPRVFRVTISIVGAAVGLAGRAGAWAMERRLGVFGERLQIEKGMHEGAIALGLPDSELRRIDASAADGT